MVQKLTAGVLVRDSGGTLRFLKAGSELPQWAQGRVGDHVLSGTAGTAKPAPAEVDVTVRDIDGSVRDATVEVTAAEPPPRSGRGSGRDAWSDYATAQGVEVTEDMERNEIIAACQASGVPVD